MATTFARVPFGELGASRLQALQSAKNRQNAITEMIKSNKASEKAMSSKDSLIQLSSPTKRSASNAFDHDNNSDSENVDPVVFSPKRAKCTDFLKPSSAFSLSVDKSIIPMNQSFNSPLKRKQFTPEPGPLALSLPTSAPTAREILPIKHKRIGILSKARSVSLSPFKRVDPPAKAAAGSIPFSIDAALSGTLSYTPSKASSKASKAQPKGWFFEIHEDTLDETLQIELQHCTNTIDLSSDDEEGPSQKRLKRGKENIPPHEADAMALEAEVPRVRARSAKIDAMNDDGDRSPLSDLAPEDFYANGLDVTSVTVVGDSFDAAESFEEDATVVKEKICETIFQSAPILSSPVPPTQDVFDFAIAEDSDAGNS